MMSTSRTSRPWIGHLPYAAIFLVGVCIRVRHILFVHDPRDFVRDNAKLYLWLAEHLAAPGYVLRPVDVFVPPGAPLLFSFLYARDPTLTLAVRAMLALTILIPLVVGGLGWVAFGKPTGQIAMAISSVYFPFIDYGGYFLTETPFTLLFALTMLFFLVAIRRQTPAAVLGWSVAAGVACSLAIAFKIVALPAMFCLVAAFVLGSRPPPAGGGQVALTRPATRKLKALVTIGVLVGAMPLTTAMTVRCTRANEARLCFVCNKGPADFLLGHYGRIERLAWSGENAIWALSASAAQHGYKDRPVVMFDVTDGTANLAAAWRWIGGHPGEAFVLSCEHVYDLFCGSLPAPGIDTASWIPMEASHFAFLLLLLLPSVLLAFDLTKTCGLRAFLGSTAFLVGSPMFGLIAATFIATGEARYRIPFDPIFILLATQFYRRYAPAPCNRGAESQ
jgi:hypothetical protein